ncbi:MAG: FAD-dependent oxidoreductase [Acidobacteria bacterium]|nr:FAD-dependent oxidoreductase [Acidobacteriota bacterium]
MAVGRVVIVGAGPAGAALAYLLARRGVEVTLLERHRDFARTFRGDGLQPSGIDAFDQMGLGDRLRQLPRAIINTIDLYQGGRRRARIATESLGFIGCFIPQPAVLAMLTEESRKHPSFQLHLGTAFRDLIRAGDRVVGVQADGPDGPREFPADLVIGTDGRYSTVRKRGAFTELPSPQHFDVLNFMVPFPDFWPDRTTVRLELGPGCLTGGIPTADGRLWVGMTIQKGQYKALKAAGPEGLSEELLHRTSPDLAAHLRANAEALKHPALLDVMVGRLETWTGPGLLLLGDAAHPMSPNGGQGINVALRDALVAANHLCPVLTRGNDDAAIDAAARQVAAERMPEIVAIQEHQRKQTQTFLRSDRFSSRLAMRILPLLAKSSLLRLLFGKRLRALQHGVVPVRLTA